MAIRTKAEFEALYGTSGTVFPDNTTGEISEGDVRGFGQDIADSLYGASVIGGLTSATIDIGDWDMDTNAIKNVSLSSLGITHANIRQIMVSVRSDADAAFFALGVWQFPYIVSGVVQSSFGVKAATPDEINLARESGSVFDSTDFNSTSFNRGWVTIFYTS